MNYDLKLFFWINPEPELPQLYRFINKSVDCLY